MVAADSFRVGHAAPTHAKNRPRRSAVASPTRGPSTRRSGARSPSTTGATTRRMRRPSPMRNTTPCAGATRRSRRGFRSSRAAESLTAEGRREGVGEIRQGAAPRADAVARQRLRGRGRRASSSSASGASCSQAGGAARLHGRAEDRRPVAEPALRGRAASSPPRPAATARRARTSPRTPARSSDIPQKLNGKDVPGDLRGARRGLSLACRFRRHQRAPGGGRQAALRQSAQRRRRQPAPARSRRSPRRGRCASSPMPGAR